MNNVTETSTADPDALQPVDESIHVLRHSPRGDYNEKWKHHDVEFLIRSTANYIVHIDKNGDIDWETSAEHDEINAANEKNSAKVEKLNTFLNDCAVLETTPCDGLDATVVRNFKRLIGEAIACALDGNNAAAQKMVGEARQYLRKRSEETSRSWYLSASFKTALPIAFIGIVLWLLRDDVTALFGATGFWLILAACVGAIGALFSVITRSGKLSFDCSAGKDLHTLEAISRITAGTISGFLVALTVNAEIILAPLTKGGHLHFIMILVAVAAGAGERLASSIISKFDSSATRASAASDVQKGKGKLE